MLNISNLGDMLAKVWRQQQHYNDQVKQRQQRSGAEWAQTYILGMVSELGELLTAMRWKQHRLETLADFGPNVKEELVDLTKYIFSFWQLLGYTPKEMLNAVYEKGLYLDKVFQQDFENVLGNRVALLDVDNVLANLDAALVPFMAKYLADDKLRVADPDIHLDVMYGWEFERYREAKNLFETKGGYRTLEPVYHLQTLFTALNDQGFSIVTYTARPVTVFRKIRLDTFQWFLDHGVMPDELRFGRDERISYACQLQATGRTVVLVDDNAGTVKRAQISGIPCVLATGQSLTSLVMAIADKADEYEQRTERAV